MRSRILGLGMLGALVNLAPASPSAGLAAEVFEAPASNRPWRGWQPRNGRVYPAGSVPGGYRRAEARSHKAWSQF